MRYRIKTVITGDGKYTYYPQSNSFKFNFYWLIPIIGWLAFVGSFINRWENFYNSELEIIYFGYKGFAIRFIKKFEIERIFVRDQEIEKEKQSKVVGTSYTYINLKFDRHEK